MELLSATVAVIDFVDTADTEALNTHLRTFTDRTDPPAKQHQTAIPGPSFTAQHWGEITARELPNDSASISITTLTYPPLNVHFVLATVDIENDALNRIWEDEEELDSIKTGIETWWDTEVSEHLPGLVAQSDRKVTISPPITLTSATLRYPAVTDFFDGDLDNGRVSTDDLVTTIREHSEIGRLGMNLIGLISVTSTAGWIGVIGQTEAVSDNYGYNHDGYIFIELTTHEEEILDHHLDTHSQFPETELIPSATALPFPNDRIRRMLPLLYLVFRFRKWRVIGQDYGTQLRSLSQTAETITDPAEDHDEIDAIHRQQTAFYEDYASILDHVRHARILVDREHDLLSDRFHGEVPVPLPGELAQPTEAAESPGVIENLIDDVSRNADRVETQYERIRTRYDVMSNQIERIIDVAVSRNSLQLQRRISRLTWGIVALTVVLVVLTILLLVEALDFVV